MKILLIVLGVMIIVGVAGVYYWENKNLPLSQFFLKKQQPVTKLLLFNKVSSEITATDFDSGVKLSFYKIPDSGVKDAKYKKNELVYIKTDNGTDKLININIKADTRQEIDNVYHGYKKYSQEYKEKAISINKISGLSPNADYVTYTSSGFIGGVCSEIIKNLKDKSELLRTDDCGTIKWSQDNKRIVFFSGGGINKKNRIALTQKGETQKLVDIDFGKVQGDANKIKFSTGDKYLDTYFINGDFINNDKIVFLSYDYDSGRNIQKIFIYDDSKKELKYITTIGRSIYEFFPHELVYVPKLNSVLINSYDLGEADKEIIRGRFVLVDLSTGTQKQVAVDISQEIARISGIVIEDVLPDGKTVVLSVAKKTFSLDLEKNQYIILSEDKDVIYAGFDE